MNYIILYILCIFMNIYTFDFVLMKLYMNCYLKLYNTSSIYFQLLLILNTLSG